MFRRLQSGLPKDPVYPADLTGLGYYITEGDEIRNIENPKAFFKFFLTKNDRYNCVQREAMNEVIRNIVIERLEDLGMQMIRLPLGATATQPHVPIFISSELATKKRIIILFYEESQDLGIFAHRIIGGKDGINAGSAVNMVKHIQSLHDAPGIVLANMGQLRWWRRGRKAVTRTSWAALPQRSVVESIYRFDEVKNTIPGNRSTAEHVDYIFNHVIEELASPKASLNVIGVSDGAVQVANFLENPENWNKWSKRVDAFAGVATYFHASDITNEDFAVWLRDRGRAYIPSSEPCGTFLYGPNGTKRDPAHGCPTFSLEEPFYSELMLPKGYQAVIDWFQEVAQDENYANPELIRYDVDGDEEEDDVEGWEVGGDADHGANPDATSAKPAET